MTISRRHVIRGAGLAGLSLLVSGTHAAPNANGDSLAATTSGQVRGRRMAGVHVFKGIRYGASTGGKNRFLPPRAPAAWNGIALARQDGPQCFQNDPFAKIPNDHHALPESEDCLRLNVWTPGLRDGKKRPVMVWLHGGGLWRGSAAGEWQSGTRLSARGDVVMVSPNHRLNLLAYSDLETLDPYFKDSGNVGLLDLVLALRWVRDNIAEFGGDPGNVTIFGQSGGGQKVSFLMAMPAAHGLFHRAIIQSGPAPVTIERDYAADNAHRLLLKLGLGPTSVRKIQDIPARQLMRAYYELFHADGGFGVLGIIQGFAPVVDGSTLPQQPFWQGASPVSRDIPLLIGSTRTEMTEYTLNSDPAAAQMGWAAIQAKLAALFNSDAPAILARFRADHPQASPWEVYSLILSDWPTRVFSVKIAQEQARLRGAPVHMYRMDWRTPVRGGLLMSPHAVDIAFVLDTVQANIESNGGGTESQRMADQMSSVWIAFARTGNPQIEQLPQWPAYEEQHRATMLFNLPSRVAFDPDAADRRIIQDNVNRYRFVARSTSTT